MHKHETFWFTDETKRHLDFFFFDALRWRNVLPVCDTCSEWAAGERSKIPQRVTEGTRVWFQEHLTHLCWLCMFIKFLILILFFSREDSYSSCFWSVFFSGFWFIRSQMFCFTYMEGDLSVKLQKIQLTVQWLWLLWWSYAIQEYSTEAMQNSSKQMLLICRFDFRNEGRRDI